MTSLPLRPELRGIDPYGAPQLEGPHQLNVNENPYAPPAEVIEEIVTSVRAAAATLNRYPDRDFIQLRADLARYLSAETGVPLEPAQIWAANGSNEVMQHLFQAYGGPGRTALSFTPTYSMYPEYARDTHTTWVTGPRLADYSIDLDVVHAALATHQPSLLVLASPNNPTGTALDLDTITAILAAARTSGPDGGASVVVIDEAYGEFRREGVPSSTSLLAQHPHLAVSRTMSKAFAFAGVRLGYLAAAPELIRGLEIVRLPYHLSAVTQAVARAALRHADLLQAQVADLRTQRDALVTWLRERGFEALDSDANFVMFGRFADRHAIWQGLLDRNVLIRETGPEGFLRVSIGTPEQTAAFRQALLEVTSS